MSKIAVIGAGVSGLSIAQMLRGCHKVVVFEANSTPGGLIRCKRVNGSLFHTCGGHVFNSKKQEVLDWFWKRFDRDKEFTLTDRNSVVFMPDGKHIPYPIENHAYLFSDEMLKRFVKDIVEISRCQNISPPLLTLKSSCADALGKPSTIAISSHTTRRCGGGICLPCH